MSISSNLFCIPQDKSQYKAGYLHGEYLKIGCTCHKYNVEIIRISIHKDKLANCYVIKLFVFQKGNYLYSQSAHHME